MYCLTVVSDYVVLILNLMLNCSKWFCCFKINKCNEVWYSPRHNVNNALARPIEPWLITVVELTPRHIKIYASAFLQWPRQNGSNAAAFSDLQSPCSLYNLKQHIGLGMVSASRGFVGHAKAWVTECRSLHRLFTKVPSQYATRRGLSWKCRGELHNQEGKFVN